MNRGLGTVLYFVSLFNSWHLLRRMFGHTDDFEMCVVKTKARAQRRKTRQSRLGVTPDGEDDVATQPAAQGKQATKEKFIQCANDATSAEAKMRRTFALGQLLFFEDLPMAVLNGIVIGQELKAADCSEQGALDTDTGGNLIIVLVSFTFSVALLCLKLKDFSNIPKQKKLAEILQKEAEELMAAVGVE